MRHGSGGAGGFAASLRRIAVVTGTRAEWGLLRPVCEAIRAELHSHTTASDGAMSIDELVAEAERRGMAVPAA